MMKQKKIRLSSVADAKEFVRRAVECDFDVDVFYNRVIIDAKSILGVLSLDLTKELTVEYDGENQEFEEFLVEKDAAKVHASRRGEKAAAVPNGYGGFSYGPDRPSCRSEEEAWSKRRRRPAVFPSGTL